MEEQYFEKLKILINCGKINACKYFSIKVQFSKQFVGVSSFINVAVEINRIIPVLEKKFFWSTSKLVKEKMKRATRKRKIVGKKTTSKTPKTKRTPSFYETILEKENFGIKKTKKGKKKRATSKSKIGIKRVGSYSRRPVSSHGVAAKKKELDEAKKIIADLEAQIKNTNQKYLSLVTENKRLKRKIKEDEQAKFEGMDEETRKFNERVQKIKQSIEWKIDFNVKIREFKKCAELDLILKSLENIKMDEDSLNLIDTLEQADFFVK